eukprot:TRINITY_DN727_c0_g1_i1.p1 TRINITY_DN727_c0_g1~~TRINITY_DN727_c0_g1_i1.p1  ORF type:complete len:427 (-),score=50.10 TRINITY_DN727_c0_g1_i1:706-1986(-)
MKRCDLSTTLAIATLLFMVSSQQQNQSIFQDRVMMAAAPDIEGLILPTSNDIIGAQTSFGLSMMTEVCEQNKNCVFSPYSVYNALGMLLLAANGNTESQLMDVMELSQFENVDEMHEIIGDTVSLVQLDGQKGDVVVSIANNVFVSNLIPVAQEYIDALSAFYEIDGPETVDFGNSEEATQIINDYVETNTQGLINDLFNEGDFDELTLMVLLNAIYFNASWAYPFDILLTRDQEFFPEAGVDDLGTPIMVPMMEGEGYFQSAYLSDMQVLEMDYAGGQFAMYVIVPEVPIAEFLVGEELLYSFMDKLRGKMAIVRIPKFSLKDKTNLKQVMMSMGITDVFDETLADLTNMVSFNANPYITNAVHEARIDVNELGTEAGAATGIISGLESGSEYFIVNKPFIYMVVHKPTNSVLFMGQVVDPTLEE